MTTMLRPSREHTRTPRRHFAVLVLALASCTPALLAQSAGGGRCPLPRSTTATLGIPMFVCYGGNCILFDSTAQGPSHTFTVEPLLRHVRPGGPAAGKLRDGDAVIAVNGALITTQEAGRALAVPIAGHPIRFRVRRAGGEAETVVTPVAGCEDLTILVSDGPEGEVRAMARAGTIRARRDSAQRDAGYRSPLEQFRNNRVIDRQRATRSATVHEIRVEFGLSLDCTDCGWEISRSGGALRWHAMEPPRVGAVEPGGPAARAGLRVGDVLEAIDDAPFSGGDTSVVWESLRPGKTATLRLRRGSAAIEVAITPRSPRRSRL